MAAHPADTAFDIELVHSVRAGDVAALGTLLVRHRPAMLAVAYGLMGYGPEAEDAVQEASLVALRRIGDVRDPQAVGAWLRTVVRNACRMRLRRPGMVSLDAAPGFAESLPSNGPDPAELLERHVLRDWIWSAVEQLPAPQRLAVMLRYFTGASTYQQIAVASGVPIGTVRSRLSEARGRLARSLSERADVAYGDVSAVVAAREREAEEMLTAVGHGQFASAVASYWAPDAEVVWPNGRRTTGYDRAIRVLDRDLGAGVRMRLSNVVAGSEIAIWETDLINPADDPDHCPPAAVWIHQLRGDRVSRFRLLHAARTSEPAHFD
jgi:RNA polymerase sigma-70 factor (ECF subfamily)